MAAAPLGVEDSGGDTAAQARQIRVQTLQCTERGFFRPWSGTVSL